MRVLMTTDTVGGVWTFTQDLARGLLECGCGVALFSVGGVPNGAQREWVLTTERLWGDAFRFDSMDVPLEWMQKNAGAYRNAAPALMQLAEAFEADIFHSNQFCFGALPLEMPKIVTSHSDVLSWAEACRTEPLEASIWLQAYTSLVERGLAGANAVVAPTRWMLEALGKNFSVSERRDVIYNGTDVACSADGPRKLQAVTAGRMWDEAKGLELLRSVHSPVPMLLAGAMTHAGGCDGPAWGQTQAVGELSREALLSLFGECAIYVCTSKYEPFGLAPLEAALCGCAVVANDLPSLREVWGDGALYFEGGRELECVLERLSSDAQALKEARARSLKRAKRFNRKAMVLKYLATFEELHALHRESCCVA